MKRRITISESQIIRAINKVVSEARRNPETNVDENFDEFFNRMIQKAPIKDVFVSFRDTTHVTDVNPVNAYNTPTGFYTYPLVAFGIPDNPNEVEFRRKFPFANDKEYINFFMLKNHDGILTSGTDKTTLDEYVKKIKKLYNGVGEIEKLCDSFIDGSYSSDYKKSPVHDTHLLWLLLYDITKDMQKKSKQNRINLICRKIGVNGFIDYEGHGFIHPAEPNQAIFFKVKNLGEVFIYEKPKLSNNAFKGMIQNKKYQFEKELTDNIDLISLLGKYGFINKNGELVSKQLFDTVFEFENGFIRVKVKDKWNLMGENGRLLSRQWFDWVDDFQKGFVAVELDDKYNFINQSGELISKQWFDMVRNFTNGLARVELDDKYNMIKQNGELLFPKQWMDNLGEFQGDYAPMGLNDRWNFIDKNGDVLFPEQWFDWVDRFKDGIASVRVDDGYNLIKQDGELLFPNQWFDSIYNFKDGLANVKLNGSFNLINRDGKLIFKEWASGFIKVFEFKSGLALVRCSLGYNFINKNGDLLHPNQWFDYAGEFEVDSAPIKMNDKGWNFINQKGKILFPKQWFDSVIEFRNVIAKVNLKGKLYNLDVSTGDMSLA